MSEINLKTLLQERDRLLKKVEVVERAIKEYEDESEHLKIVMDNDGNYVLEFKSYLNEKMPLDGFPIKDTWLNQILYILQNRNRFLSNQEIAKALTDYHYDFNVDKMKRKVSVVISAAYKTDKVIGLTKVGTTKSAKDALWGFDDWLTGDKKIKEEHQPFGWNLKQKINVG